MTDKALTDFIADFIGGQAKRERIAQESEEKRQATMVEALRHLVIKALGLEVLAALFPVWGYKKDQRGYAWVVLSYKDETFTIKVDPRIQKGMDNDVKVVQELVAGHILDIDKEQAEMAESRVRLAVILKARPLPDHVTRLWWGQVKDIVSDDAGLLTDWEAAMVVFDERVQDAKAQEEKRCQQALNASREFALERLAAFDKCFDARAVHVLRDSIPPTVLDEGRRTIQEAAFERLQRLDEIYLEERAAMHERVQQLELDAFWPFRFYEVHYQTGVYEEDGYPGVETAKVTCCAPECTEEGWWKKTDGTRVRLPFVSKVIERVVSSCDDAWWSGGVWKWAETDDGLKYRVPSPLAARADDACAQAKGV